MFDNIFGIHEQALLLHGQRLGVLATNIANSDTPNYKARDIDFSAVLSHTDEVPLSHPSEPESPVAASTVWPCATIASKIKFSGATRPNSIAIGSQKPALVLTTRASSSACIAPHAARMAGGVLGTS